MTISPSDLTVPATHRRFRKRWLLYAAGLLIGLLLVARIFNGWSFDDPLPPDLASVGDLPVTLANGQAALLSDTIQPGVPTVISLWASWCGPCFREAPKIAELRRKFPPDALNIVYLNVRDPTADLADLAAYMKRFDMPLEYVILRDAERLSDLTNDPKNLIPRTLVFDRDGRPMATIVGYKPLALGRIEGLVAE